MNKYIAILFIGAALNLPLIAMSADFPNYPNVAQVYLQEGDRSFIQISCDPDLRKGNRIDCSLIQTNVSYKVNPDEYEAKLKESLENINTPEFEKELLGEPKKLCQQKDKAERKANITKIIQANPASETRMRRWMALLDQMCEAKNLADVKTAFIAISKLRVEQDTKTCKVWLNDWEESFEYKRSSTGGYWLSTAEPHGECGVINISTLKSDPDFSFGWNYESRRVVTDKEAESLIPCNDIEERKVTYKWLSVEHDMHCEVITFGL